MDEYVFALKSLNFWNHHGVIFLMAIAIFPRLTLLFSSVPFGGILWWIGFFIAPRFLVAILATINYWVQNPILVVIAWLMALSGETKEKTVITRRYRTHRQKKNYPDAIDAEYKELK